jgi:hypothetical protein
MRETLKELRVILLNISPQKPLYIQERPGPVWLEIVALFGLILQLYSRAVLLDFEGLKVEFLAFYMALDPLYKTVRREDKHQPHLSLLSEDLNF